MEQSNSEININAEQISAELNNSLDGLSSEIPVQPQIALYQRKVEYQNEIDGVNAKAEAAMIDSRAKLINLYIDCEKERLEQQKPLLEAIIRINSTLVWLFNIIIALITAAVIVLCFLRSDINVLGDLLNFLKYYVGAVVVELIGMLFFIVRGIFSSNYNKVIESVLKPESKKK